MANNSNNTKVFFEIKEHLGIISDYKQGWQKELNIVSWNGQPPKYDIREWDEDHERMSRGVTLRESEMTELIHLFTSFTNKIVLDNARQGEEASEDIHSSEPKEDNVPFDECSPEETAV